MRGTNRKRDKTKEEAEALEDSSKQRVQRDSMLAATKRIKRHKAQFFDGRDGTECIDGSLVTPIPPSRYKRCSASAATSMSKRCEAKEPPILAKHALLARSASAPLDCIKPLHGHGDTTEPLSLQVLVSSLPNSTSTDNAVITRASDDEEGGFVHCPAFLAVHKSCSQAKLDLLRDGVWNSLPLMEKRFGIRVGKDVVRGALQFLDLLCNRRICGSCDDVATSGMSSLVIAILCLGLAYAGDEVAAIDILECTRVNLSEVRRFEWLFFCASVGQPSCRA
jgi:hypothetical protein